MTSLYLIIRFALAIIIGLTLFIICSKKNAKIVTRLLVVVVAYVLYIGLTFLPLENSLGLFETPQDVAVYCYSNELITAIEGESTALLVLNGSNLQIARVNKTKNGWGYDLRQGFGFNTRTYLVRDAPYYAVYIHENDDTTDKFIQLAFSDRSLKNEYITDTDGNLLFGIILNKQSDAYSSLMYFGYINSNLENYGFYLDGELILLKELEELSL